MGGPANVFSSTGEVTLAAESLLDPVPGYLVGGRMAADSMAPGDRVITLEDIVNDGFRSKIFSSRIRNQKNDSGGDITAAGAFPDYDPRSTFVCFCGDSGTNVYMGRDTSLTLDCALRQLKQDTFHQLAQFLHGREQHRCVVGRLG